MVTGKDDREEVCELCDVEVESMYPFVAFFDLLCLEKVVDVEDSDSEIGFFVRLLFLEISEKFVSVSVSGSIAASSFLLIGVVKGIWGNSATDLISRSTFSILSRQIS